MCLCDISDVTAHASGSLAHERSHLPQSLVCYYLQLADGETEAYRVSDLLMIDTEAEMPLATGGGGAVLRRYQHWGGGGFQHHCSGSGLLSPHMLMAL